jgi:DNA mismatch endonuclease (patch repair protein)
VRSLVHRMGLRFRLHDRRLPGTPDLVLRRYETALFVHGCFWHRHHGCRLCTVPRTNVEFWDAKFARNVERDRKARKALEALGWRVVYVWECELADMERLQCRIRRLFPRPSGHAGPGGMAAAPLPLSNTRQARPEGRRSQAKRHTAPPSPRRELNQA